VIKKIIFFLKSVLILIIIFIKPSMSDYKKIFFDHKINLIDGKVLELAKYSDHVVLLVNTASYCGFTKQYNDLQKLWINYREKKFVVIAIPSNSFNQEKDKNADIKNFCETNFNITFPITELSIVKGDEANEIYKWAELNYGKSAVPKWNFHKILIGKNGKIIDTFSPFTNPLSQKIVKIIDENLN